MKTDDLIAMLASGPDVAAAAPPGASWRSPTAHREAETAKAHRG